VPPLEDFFTWDILASNAKARDKTLESCERARAPSFYGQETDQFLFISSGFDRKIILHAETIWLATVSVAGKEGELFSRRDNPG